MRLLGSSSPVSFKQFLVLHKRFLQKKASREAQYAKTKQTDKQNSDGKKQGKWEWVGLGLSFYNWSLETSVTGQSHTGG